MRGLPEELEVGEGTALRLDGELPAHDVRGIRVRFGEIERDVDGWGVSGAGVVWWCVLPVPAGTPDGRRELWLRIEGTEGVEDILLGQTDVSLRTAHRGGARSAAKARIGICMATFEPREDWLVRQVDSIRSQTREDWACFISDDCSSPDAFAVLERVVGNDPRFIVSRSERNLGFYANFERALRMVPAESELIALCDQDDRWDADKLEVLAEALDAAPAAQLVYSDMRIVSEEGRLLSRTYWYLSSNGWRDIASMAIINTVTGAASLFRRDLLDLALPFPPGGTAEHYHDHWLALCAMATGEIEYVDRPTYDYTRHVESVTLSRRPHSIGPPGTLLEHVTARWRRWTRRLRMGLQPLGWREVYLDRFLMIRQYVGVLEMRVGSAMPQARRRSLRRLERAESSPADAAWLLGRALLRPLAGHRETQGRDRVLFGSLLWRANAVWRARRRSG